MGINIPTMLLKLIAVYEPFLAQWSAPTEITLAAQAKAIFGDFSALIASDYLHTAVLLGLPMILFTSLFYTIGGPYFWLLVLGQSEECFDGKLSRYGRCSWWLW